MAKRNPRKERRHGYEVSFDPAVTRKVTAKRQGGAELVVFEAGPEGYAYPEGAEDPPAQHEIRFVGGEGGGEIGLLVDDPGHRVASITVRLYPKDRKPGGKRNPAPVETLSWANGVPTCPPICPR